VIGGGGSIGTISIQLAKHLRAHVTGVDSTKKLDLMRFLGADQVLDYTQDPITEHNQQYDLIIDVVGGKGLLERLRLLKPAGNYFLAFARVPDLLLRLWIALTSNKNLRIEASRQEKANLAFLTSLLEEGILTPQIDRTYSLAQVADAHRYAESGHKKGHIALKVRGNNN
jgi:NADPH:quinone reductase-like Zn-dependent oxidoreductase